MSVFSRPLCIKYRLLPFCCRPESPDWRKGYGNVEITADQSSFAFAGTGTATSPERSSNADFRGPIHVASRTQPTPPDDPPSPFARPASPNLLGTTPLKTATVKRKAHLRPGVPTDTDPTTTLQPLSRLENP